MSNDPLSLHSVISWKTKAELHLVPDSHTGTMAWRFLNDAGDVVALDATHTLVVEYGALGPPKTPVELQVFNKTDATVQLTVTSLANAIVSPNGTVTLSPNAKPIWTCKHSGGEVCQCTGQVECKCGTWSITGVSTSSPVPDPTFKVRWQAHTDP